MSGTGAQDRSRADAGGEANPHVRRRRAQLVGLALFFFVPLAVSFYLYYGQTGWRPLGHVNHGVLISPARPVPALTLPLLGGGTTSPKWLRGKWTMLYVESGDCLESCRKRLYDVRQVRTALDRDMDRVQRVFVAARLEDPTLLSTLHDLHPDLIVAKLDDSADPLVALLPGGAAALHAGRIYVIDPLGNLMMWYAAGAEPKGLLEDMKRLLRLSSIG